jgi:hypothetical protein
MAGYVLQTNDLALSAVVAAAAAAMFSLVEIKASRRYKELRHSADDAGRAMRSTLEGILKCISTGVLLLAAALAVWRWNG